MTDARRLRRFVIDPRELMGLLRGDTAVDLRPFPADAEAVCWGWDSNSQVLVVLVRSAEYEPVPLHREAPFSLNGPTFADKSVPALAARTSPGYMAARPTSPPDCHADAEQEVAVG